MTATPEHITQLEARLNDFDRDNRMSAFQALIALVESGDITMPPFTEEVNVHAHTFFSFNAYGYSPAAFVWRARRRGLAVAGTVDFDVLHGLEETLQCGDALGIPATSGLESRVFIPEYSDRDLNSPREPGIYYFMGTAFGSVPAPDTEAGRVLARMHELAQVRNKAIMTRVNEFLGRVALDYDADVMPLSPRGNPTERHLVAAYERKADDLLGPDAEAFWADALSCDRETIAALRKERPAFHDRIRAGLMKFGAPGYASPDSGSFPTLKEAVAMVKAAGGLPTATWLDGTSDGEKDPDGLLDFMLSEGAVLSNIIPDRNWNIADPAVQALKVEKLNAYVDACRRRHMPVIAGTEMNKHGQPFVDDFNAAALKPMADDFLKGALVLYGHTMAARFGGWTYFSDWAADAFGPADQAQGRVKRNAFYERLGRVGPVSAERGAQLAACGAEATPDTLVACAAGASSG